MTDPIHETDPLATSIAEHVEALCALGSNRAPGTAADAEAVSYVTR